MDQVVQLAVAGLPTGAIYALLGVILVLMYQTGAVLNFTQAAVGAFGTYVMMLLVQQQTPLVLAVAAAVLVGAALAAGEGWVMARYFTDQSVMTRSVVTIAMTGGLFVVTNRLFGGENRHVPALFPAVAYQVGSVSVPLGTVVSLVCALVLGLVLSAVLRSTRLGVLLRAVAERPATAELLGVRAQAFIVGVWAVGGAVSAWSIALIAPSTASDYASLALLIIPAMAAALIGVLRRSWATIAGGVLMGVLQSELIVVPWVDEYRLLVPLVVIAVVLAWSERRQVWDEAA